VKKREAAVKPHPETESNPNAGVPRTSSDRSGNAPVNGAELGEYCRSKGIFPEEIEEWREACPQANQQECRKRQELQKEIRNEKRRSKALEKELLRKDRALAETAALLTLRKKAQAIWGEDEAD
jgi:hypothetical protein